MYWSIRPAQQRKLDRKYGKCEWHSIASGRQIVLAFTGNRVRRMRV